MNSSVACDAASLRFSRQGEYAVLCDANLDGALDLALQQRFWSLADALRQEAGVAEAVLGMNNILVIFKQAVRDLDNAAQYLSGMWSQSRPVAGSGRVVTVPVTYGGADAKDLAFVAQTCGLSVQRYVELHSAATYVVYALGSQPGFAYLGGLPSCLAVARREVPRPSVKAGAVIIGGGQAGIQSRTTPSGWHIIGMSDLQCFDVHADTPALLAPGDQLKFVVKDVQS